MRDCDDAVPPKTTSAGSQTSRSKKAEAGRRMEVFGLEAVATVYSPLAVIP